MPPRGVHWILHPPPRRIWGSAIAETELGDIFVVNYAIVVPLQANRAAHPLYCCGDCSQEISLKHKSCLMCQY